VWRCSWDPRKDALNRRKHGVAFAVAATVLDDPLALMGYDRNQSGEDRWRMIGRSIDGDTLVIVFAIRDGEDEEIVRLISARHALRRERVAYEQQAH
jgi:hypothetical protein